MADKIILTLTEKDNSIPCVLTKCINMKFSKSWLTPYSILFAEFAIDSIPQGDIIDATLSINDIIIHKGMICESKVLISKGINFIKIFSKGYTYSLTKSQLTEQLVYDVLPENIIALDPDIKYVTCMYDYRYADYIKIAEKSTIWNAICSLSNKVSQHYPYIRYPNEVAMVGIRFPMCFKIPESDIINACKCNDYTDSISKITMDNAIYTEPDYCVSSDYANEHNISIHRYINYNEMWCSSPLDNLQLYINSKSIKGSYTSVMCNGFKGQDLFDLFRVLNPSTIPLEGTIHEIEITANKKGLFTTLVAYTC